MHLCFFLISFVGNKNCCLFCIFLFTGKVSEFAYATQLDPNIISENKMIYLQTFGESWGLMPDQYAVGFLDK